jgi:Lrp/AsnC family leucine-responsive transcriptional regulator
MSHDKIDEIDLHLLDILQAHGRTKRNELAEKVNLSLPAVSERLRRLEEHGVIRCFATVLQPQRLGLDITAFIFVSVESSSYYEGFIRRAAKVDEIQECHAITGDGSHLLKVRTQNTATLEKLLSTVQAWPGVKNTKTNLVLSSPKETASVPLSHLKGQNT